jgi:membrane protease YdiL (CAAX protease family)
VQEKNVDTDSETISKNTKTHRTVSWSLIIGLLLIRIPVLGVIGIFSKSEWLVAIYQLVTYLLTAIFLWWECKNLKDFHVDALAIWIIILFKPIETLILKGWGFNTPLTFPKISGLLIWLISIGLTIALWFRRKDLPKFQWKSLGWFGVGILIGIGTNILLAIPGAFQVDFGVSPATFWSLFKSQALMSFIYQIGYAAVSEEPLFRGFLWGALRKAGWKDVWIWIFQAALFMLSHIYYLGKYPISFFIVVPVAALILGLVAWKSRTISASMATHGAVNALGLLMDRLAAYYIK